MFVQCKRTIYLSIPHQPAIPREFLVDLRIYRYNPQKLPSIGGESDLGSCDISIDIGITSHNLGQEDKFNVTITLLLY